MQHRLGLLSSARSTKQSYIREVKDYIAFCAERSLAPLNSSPAQLNIYQLQQKAAGKADATINNIRIAVNHLLAANGQQEIAKPKPDNK